MQRIEAFWGRLPFVERGRPFIETRQGRYCHRLLLRERERLIGGGQRAEIIVEEQGVKLVYDFRQSPYGKEEQYKGVKLYPVLNERTGLGYTWLADGGNAVTDWADFWRGTSYQINMIWGNPSLSSDLRMAMRFAWHHPHDFRDGPRNPKR